MTYTLRQLKPTMTTLRTKQFMISILNRFILLCYKHIKQKTSTILISYIKYITYIIFYTFYTFSTQHKTIRTRVNNSREQ